MWRKIDVTGAEIRLRITVASDQRDAARAAVAKVRDDLLVRGASLVKVEEEVRPTLRARAPEVARAVTLRDKLEAHWAALGATPEEPRRGVLLSKLVAVEEEVRRAA